MVARGTAYDMRYVRNSYLNSDHYDDDDHHHY